MSSIESDLQDELESVSGARKSAFPDVFAPMLANPAERAFSSNDWLFEPKLDGIRCIAMVRDGKVRLLSRRGLEITYQYPALAKELTELCSTNMVLDGEIIALNEQGRPSFQHLQQRMNLTKRADIARAEANVPAYFFIFDIMHIAGYSLTSVKLVDRKPLIARFVQQSMRIRILNGFTQDGVAAYEACVESGFEGIVAKRGDSRYESGRRSPAWLKVKAQQTGEFVIGGYTAGQGSRSTIFGALMLGYYDDQKHFVHAGSVGTGFDDRLLRDVMKRIKPLTIDNCPFHVRPDEKKEVTWVAPQLVIEVKFMDWTRDGHLRTPVFLRFRDDKEAESIERQNFVRPYVAPLPSVIGSRVAEGVRSAYAATSDAASSTKDEPARADPAAKGRKQAPTGKTAMHCGEKNGVVPDALPVIATSSVTATRKMPAAVDSPAWQYEFTSKEHLDLVEAVVAQLQQRETNFMLHVAEHKFQITSLDKQLWPKTDESPLVTKRDYLTYLAQISSAMLPQLHSRPLTIIRSPWGVRGKPFYQKHWHTAIPEFFETTVVPDEDDEDGRREHLLCNNLATLLFLGQNGILEYHVMPARIERGTDMEEEQPQPLDSTFGSEKEIHIEDNTAGWLLNYPDYLVFDLDYHTEKAGKDAKYKPRAANKSDFAKVCEVACVLRDVLVQLHPKPLVKVSGKGGIHLYVPIKRNLDFEHARVLSETMSRVATAARGDLITLDLSIDKRRGKVFMDAGANIAGKTVISAYSARITEDSTVSMPVTWAEIEAAQWIPCQMQNALDRVKTSGDLWKDILREKVDLKAKISANSKT